eukprot:CAMPEP_0118705190 /NCGR_PEP_ID=MMETSP0800-20121206/19721_1 /TAXON_ID=210618 ORGANISM="Striatella unipunctata, Strain CCMP2910" /NCGR_SAMPLE_ID=MMETSP0800 /ASSEMBLY_ACC=CAM_ASM_000638 /LENGTH=222 /DNA_ID=CAMNT_0006607299 /DNA_START=727 /DNA_END=1395 /DNA_ORIENTATION=+
MSLPGYETCTIASASEPGALTYEIQRELKSCNHYCYPSNLSKCCACEDLRPISDGYETYVDGIGYTTTRDDGYCPVCNTKNYDRWAKRVKEETERKQKEDEEKQLKQNEENQRAEADRQKHTHKSNGRIEYTNGNIYEGELRDGLPHGFGRMDYADNDDDILYYEGDWVNGQHQGNGTKVWMDDLWYKGEWYQGMMHGQGKCHVNEVDVMEGRFEEDVFQDE